MNRTSNPVFAVVVSQMLAALGVVAHGVEPSCQALIKQMTPRADLPYRVEQDIRVDGKIKTNHAVYIDGYVHVQADNGQWMLVAVDPRAVEALALETTRECKLTASDTVGGMKMNVWTIKTINPMDPLGKLGRGLLTSRAWVGSLDGRVYRQKSDDFEQRIAYDNVVKPNVTEPKSRQKTKHRE